MASPHPGLAARTDGLAPLTRLFWGVGANNHRAGPAALILAPDTTLVCRIASAANPRGVSGTSVKAAAAPRLEVCNAVPVAADTHIESAFGFARFGDDAVEIRFGDEGLRLDFSP